jgi:hypothetical protein
MRKLLPILCLLFVFSGSLFATTDLQISSVTVSEGFARYIAAVEVYANNDAAENVTLNILIPAGSTVTALDTPDQCKVLKSMTGDTMVQCNLGHINVEDSKTVSVDVDKNGNSTFSAFVFSNSADGDPTNNFGYGSFS